jgi:hypothetical protein
MTAPYGAEGVNFLQTSLGKGFQGNGESYTALKYVAYWDSAQLSGSASIGIEPIPPATNNNNATTQYQYQINLLKVFQSNRFSSVQSAFIDNSHCRYTIQVTTELGQSFIVPAFSQGVYSLIAGVGAPVITFTANSTPDYSLAYGTNQGVGSTDIMLLNKEHPPYVSLWPTLQSSYRLINSQANPFLIGPIPLYQAIWKDTDAFYGKNAGQILYNHYGNTPVYQELGLDLTINNTNGGTYNFYNIDFYILDTVYPPFSANATSPVTYNMADFTKVLFYKKYTCQIPANGTAIFHEQIKFNPPHVGYWSNQGQYTIGASTNFSSSCLMGICLFSSTSGVGGSLYTGTYVTASLTGSVGDVQIY